MVHKEKLIKVLQIMTKKAYQFTTGERVLTESEARNLCAGLNLLNGAEKILIDRWLIDNTPQRKG